MIDSSVAIAGDSQNPEEEPGKDGGWVTILPWVMLAVFYLLAAGSDPTPETTWTTFYREMLSTGEVSSIHLLPSVVCYLICLTKFSAFT